MNILRNKRILAVVILVLVALCVGGGAIYLKRRNSNDNWNQLSKTEKAAEKSALSFLKASLSGDTSSSNKFLSGNSDSQQAVTDITRQMAADGYNKVGIGFTKQDGDKVISYAFLAKEEPGHGSILEIQMAPDGGGWKVASVTKLK